MKAPARVIVALVAVAIGVIVAFAILHPFHFSKVPEEGSGKSLVVLCGAGLMKPMNELIKEFEKREGVKVYVDYGGSGEIYAKLEMGMGDVFIPGAYYYIRIALDKGYVIPSTVVNITLHIPVIAVPKGNPKHIRGLEDLVKPGVKLAIGNPKACAIGRVAIALFKKNGLYDKFLEKYKRGEVVEAPTVNQLLLYVATRQVDAAIIWEDMVTWAQAKGKVEIVHIPEDENIIKTIAAAVTIYAKKHGVYEEAKKFVEFISSKEGLKIWEKWGFKPCSG